MTVTLKRNARVALYGDSFMSICQPYIAYFYGLRNKGIVTICHNFGGTAMCDWYSTLESTERPDLALFLFVGNFLTPCTQTGKGWLDEWSAEIERAMADCSYLGIPAAWIVPPNDPGTPVQSHPLRPYIVFLASKYGHQVINCDMPPSGPGMQENGLYVAQTSDGQWVKDSTGHPTCSSSTPSGPGAARMADAICAATP